MDAAMSLFVEFKEFAKIISQEIPRVQHFNL